MELIDGHSHLLPGVDDGSPTLEYTKTMLLQCREVGITHVVCTPHFRGEWGEPDKVEMAFKATEPVAEECGIKLACGHEFYWRMFNKVNYEQAAGLTLGNSNLFLLEFSMHEKPQNWQTIVYKLQAEGLEIIIAHPERFFWIQQDIDLLEEIKDAGCMTMISANFINKGKMDNGGAFKTATKKMLKRGLVDIVASDAHRDNSYADFKAGLKYAVKHGYDVSRSNAILSRAFG